MSNITNFPCTFTFEALGSFLGEASSRKIAPNTVVTYRRFNYSESTRWDHYSIRHHKTVIAEIHSDYLILRNGGYYSRTTKNRLSAVLRDNGLDLAGSCKNGWSQTTPKCFNGWIVTNVETGEEINFRDGLKLLLK